MASIPGTIPVTSGIAPTDTTDTFATHIDIYGQGGYMTVADQTEREAITSDRRKVGMAVFQNDTNEMYILQNGVTNADWVLFSGGGGGSQDLQSVLDNGSQFTLTPPYTGGALDINYTTATGNPFDPTVNSNSGIRIKQNLPGSAAGEDIYIASSASAESGQIALHAQNVGNFPTVPYSRLTISEGGIFIDSNSSNFTGTVAGDVMVIRNVTTGAGGGSTNYTLGTEPGIKQLKVNLNDTLVQALHTTGYDLILSGGIPSNKLLNVLNIMCYSRSNYTNSESLRFYLDSCTTGGGFSSPIYQADLITGATVGTGTYAGRSNSAESFGSNCQALTTRLTGASGPVVNSDGVGGIDVYVTYQFIDK